MPSIDIFAPTRGNTLATIEFAASWSKIDEIDIIKCDNLDGINVSEIKSEYVHMVSDNTIIMPEFYSAMRCYVEGNADYVSCKSLKVSDKAECLRSHEYGSNIGQILVKTWVLKDIGTVSNLKSLIVSGYKGIEIPHFLHMEVTNG